MYYVFIELIYCRIILLEEFSTAAGEKVLLYYSFNSYVTVNILKQLHLFILNCLVSLKPSSITARIGL